jgi:hypothetical protein
MSWFSALIPKGPIGYWLTANPASKKTLRVDASGQVTAEDIAAAEVTGLSEAVDDRVNGLLVAGTNVTLTYDDTANTLTVAATGGGGGVTSFNTRTGAVTPAANDYAVADISGLSTALNARLAAANNLLDVASAATARTNLGLGTAATRDVPSSGNASSTQVVLGNDSRLGGSSGLTAFQQQNLCSDNPTGRVWWRRRFSERTTSTTYSFPAYLMDRWWFNSSGGALAALLVNTTTGGMQFGNGSSQRNMALYAVPNDRTIAVRSTPLSLGLDAFCNSGTLALRWAVLAWTGTADAPNKAVVNNWASGTYTTGNFFASTTLTVVGTGNWTITTTSTRYTAENLGTVPSGANNLMLCVWNEAAGTVGVTINNVCLNPASTAATFVLPAAADEISACGQWLFPVVMPGVQFFGFTKLGSGFFSTTMRHDLRWPGSRSVVWAAGSTPTWTATSGASGNLYAMIRASDGVLINLSSTLAVTVQDTTYWISVTGSISSESGASYLAFADGATGPIGLISAEL